MTIASAVNFIQAVGQDEALKAAVAAADQESVLALAQEKGYEFSIDELRQVCETGMSNGEVDLEALDGVVGGINDTMLLMAGLGVVTGAMFGAALTAVGGTMAYIAFTEKR